MNSLYVLRFCILSVGMVLASCGSGSSGDSESRVCEPGRSVQCAGPNGCVGAQSCNADGSGYDRCVCDSTSSSVPTQGTGGFGSTSNPLNTGGALHSAGGNPIITGGTGTNINPATGGSPALSTANCAPTSMAGHVYPSYVPARRMAHSCTEQAIQQYLKDCYQGGECSAFDISGSQAQCGTCLAPTELSATAYGPLLRVGTPSAYFYETNVAGCEELLGESSCAPKMQVEFLCEYLSCLDSCPLKDGSGYYDAMYRCMDNARTTQCNQEHAAATCLTNASAAAACSGATFEQQFIAIAKVFCL